MPDLILIGGAPSSGTTLLLSMLSAHSAVHGVHESGLFSHPGMYTRFDEFRHNFLGLIRSGDFKLLPEDVLIRKGLSPHLLANSSRLAAHGIRLDKVLRVLEKAKNETKYLSALSTLVLSGTSGKSCILEKTPSNLYCMPAFHRPPMRRAIAIVRDPLDTVSSLTARGVPLNRAMCIWTLEAALALASKEAGAALVRYEDLIGNPEATLRDLQLYAGIDPEGEATSRVDIGAEPAEWRSSSKEAVSDRSIGRGQYEFDAIDRSVFCQLRIQDYPDRTLDRFIGRSAMRIAEELGYSIAPTKYPLTERVKIRAEMMASYSRQVAPRTGRSSFYDRTVSFRPVIQGPEDGSAPAWPSRLLKKYRVWP